MQIVEGGVYIGGALLNENRYVAPSGGDLEEVVLGQGQFFLMPDDRTLAVLDGAAMTVGFDRLIGRAALRVSPWSRAAFFWAG